MRSAERPKSDEQDREGEFTSEVGALNVDWPRAAGYYAAVGLAVAFEVITPPLGLFIAVVPIMKLLKRKNAPRWERFVGAVVEGAGKPVGGDAEGIVRPKWVDDDKARREEAEVRKALSSGAANGQLRTSNPS